MKLTLFLVGALVLAVWLIVAYRWRRQAQESRILLDTATLVHATLNLVEVLERTAQHAAQVCGAHRCTILLLAEDGEILLPGASQFSDGRLDREMWRRFKDACRSTAVNQSPEAQQVIREQRPLFIPDTAASSLPEHLIALCGVESVLLVPLTGQERVLGLLALDQTAAGRGFTAGQIELATAIGAQAAAAIENARLYEQAQRRVAELDELAAAADKELAAFTYAVSHDLRAPLRHLDGFSRILLEDYEEDLDATGQDHLRRVREASQRMGQLIDGLLQLYRLTRHEMRRERVDLSGLAREIAAELRETQPGREVEFIIAPGLIARGDAHLLRVALENLLGNAWKFTGKQACARIEFDYTRVDGKLVYFVRDDGDGFDMTYAGKLFVAFQRLHAMAEFEGDGIGLALVQRIVHRHGGRVWAEGVVERGATFYFTLPLRKDDAE